MLGMTQKIFNLNDSRIRMNLGFEPYYWWIRSLPTFAAGCIYYDGSVCYDYTFSIISSFLPVCSI